MAKRIHVNENDNSVTVRLRHVRLSFPSLFQPSSFDGNEENAKYGAQFLMDKEGDPEDNADFVRQAVKEVIKRAFKGKSPGDDKLCFRDGASKPELDGYGEDVFFVSASNKKKFHVVDRDLSPLEEKDGKPYAGCYVNATIRLWPQDNKFGKRVNAQLRAVQFSGDGDPFGTGMADPEEEFEDISGNSGDDDSML